MAIESEYRAIRAVAIEAAARTVQGQDHAMIGVREQKPMGDIVIELAAKYEAYIRDGRNG